LSYQRRQKLPEEAGGCLNLNSQGFKPKLKLIPEHHFMKGWILHARPCD